MILTMQNSLIFARRGLIRKIKKQEIVVISQVNIEVLLTTNAISIGKKAFITSCHFDSHLFIKQLSQTKGTINCIPSADEEYISSSKKIKVDQYRSKNTEQIISINFEIGFIDSFKFMQTSLGNLVSNLKPDDFHNDKYHKELQLLLLTRKGVYPYDYVQSFKSFF